MKTFGDVGGILLYNDPQTSKSEIEVVPTNNSIICENQEMPQALLDDDSDFESNKKLKKDDKDDKESKGLTNAELKKLKKEKEQRKEKRKKDRKKYKLFVPNNVNLYPFLACDGPCSFDINLGSQVFHCAHGEFKKGLMT